MRRFAFTMLLLSFALPCAAESGAGSSHAIGHISFKVHVPPVFKVLQARAVADGYEYRVWTNMKSVAVNGKEYRFTRVGETTLFFPSSKDAYIVHGL